MLLIYRFGSESRKTQSHLWQKCAGFGVRELTPEGVSVFQQELKQDQESVFLIGAGAGAGAGVGAGMILSRIFLTFRCLFAVYINCYTGVKQEQESINFV